MSRSIIESLESRRMFAADLSAALASTTLADTLAVGGKAKPAVAVVTVSNVGDAVDKKTAGTVTVTVGLRDAGGNVTTLGTKAVKASKLAKPTPATAAVKLALPTLAAGMYTLVATVDGGTAVMDDMPENNTAAGKSVTVTPPPPSPLSSIDVGAVMTFKTTQSGGNSVAGFETGTWKDSNGATGTYYITRGAASNGLCALTGSNGAPIAGLQFTFNGGGQAKLGGRTFTFGVDAGMAAGSVQVAGSTVFFKLGR